MLKVLTQKMQNTRTEYEVFETSSKEFMHEKFIEMEARQRNYEDRTQVDLDNRLEDYEDQMTKFSTGLNELKQIRNLIDPTIEQEIDRINKIYELKLETIVNKMERVQAQSEENEKAIDEILNKYQVEIEAMKKDFVKTAEMQNKRIDGQFDQQNDIMKDFDNELNNLEVRFKNFQVDQVKQVEDTMTTVNDMVIETKEILDSYNEKINSEFSKLDSKRNKQSISFETEMENIKKQIKIIKEENSIDKDFKERTEEEFKTIKELAGILKLLDQERIQDGKILDELRAKVKKNEQINSERFNQAEVTIQNYDKVLDSYFKEFEESLNEFKSASISDFDSLNKRLVKISNVLSEVSDHQSTQDQDIDVLKRQIRPKFEYTRKDITSPLTSTMQGVFESGSKYSPYLTRQTEVDQNFAQSETINARVTRGSEARSRDVSPNVEEILQKDLDSKRKLDQLKRSKLL